MSGLHSGPMTVSCWVYMPGGTNLDPVITKGTSAGSWEWYLEIDQLERARFYMNHCHGDPKRNGRL